MIRNDSHGCPCSKKRHSSRYQIPFSTTTTSAHGARLCLLIILCHLLHRYARDSVTRLRVQEVQRGFPLLQRLCQGEQLRRRSNCRKYARSIPECKECRCIAAITAVNTHFIPESEKNWPQRGLPGAYVVANNRSDSSS